MNFSFQLPLLFVVLLIVIAYAAAYAVYRYTVPQVSKQKRLILTALRGTALMLILIAVCEPLLRLTSTTAERPVLALLADNSLSMSQPDGATTKEERLKTLLLSDKLKSISGDADIRYFSFSPSVEPLIPESLSAAGGVTNISEALQSSLTSIDELRAILLLSDGNYNTGSNPLYTAEKSRIPIYTVGIGDTNVQKDVSVSALLTNSIGYAGVTLPVEGTINVSGLSVPSLTVSLLEDGKKIDQKIITAAAAGGVTDVPVQFSYTPKSAGVKKLSVSIPEVQGEITPKNNSRSALVKVLKSKMNIVVIAGAPGADVGAVMQSLNADNNINTGLFYQLPGGTVKHRGGESDPVKAVADADALILIGFPSTFTSQSFLMSVFRTVSERSLPVLFVAGRSLDLQKLRMLEPLLPFTVASDRIDEQSILPSVAVQSRSHQLLSENRELWEKLPPIFYSLQTFSAKAEAQQLLTVKIQNVVLNRPLFVIRNTGTAKSAALLGYGLYRWNILAGASDDTEQFFSRWLSTLIRWLATREQDKFLHVEPSREFYSQGERITFSGQAYNESYQPVDNADITVSLRSIAHQERMEISLSSLGSGLYEGAVDGLPEGDYSYSAAAVRGADTLGRTSGRITMGEQSAEFSETSMNSALLRQLAAASGGTYADVSSFDRLIDDIRALPALQPQLRTHTKEFELWHLPAFLAVIVLLFGIEWFLRKQSGML